MAENCYLFNKCLLKVFWHHLNQHYLHKDDVAPLGVGRYCTGDGRKAIRVDDRFFRFHELGQTIL